MQIHLKNNLYISTPVNHKIERRLNRCKSKKKTEDKQIGDLRLRREK